MMGIISFNQILSSLDPEGTTTTSNVGAGGGIFSALTAVVDSAIQEQVVAGNDVGIPEYLPMFNERGPLELIVGAATTFNNSDKLPPTPPPAPLTTIGNISPPVGTESTTYHSIVEPEEYSEQSVIAPYITIFNDFELKVEPVYNFWTEDEEFNESEEKGSRGLDELPRYIKIRWNTAPKLPIPEDFLPRDITIRDDRSVKFGLEQYDGWNFAFKGASFLPEHLQPDGFNLIKNSLANGYVYPAVISSVVEVPSYSISQSPEWIAPEDQSIVIDEDAFLMSPNTEGISIHELTANANQVVNGFLDTSWLNETSISPEAEALREEFFDGNFTVDRPYDGQGDLWFDGVNASSPALSFAAEVASSLETFKTDYVSDLIDEVFEPPSVSNMVESFTNNVKFIEPVLDGITDPERANMCTEQQHVESLMSVLQSLPNLEVLSRSGYRDQIGQIDAPSFPSPKEVPPLEYVGYVIEKYRLSDSGFFEKVEEIDIPDRSIDEYIDTKISYGRSYRYRIKTIIRWTRPSDVDLNGVDQFTTSFESSQTSPVAPQESTYFGSEWSQAWATGFVIDMVPPSPPDELTVRPESARNRIMITMRLPENSQRDINQMQLYKKVVDEDGYAITDWYLIAETGPQNMVFCDYDVSYFQDMKQRYVYTAMCVSKHGEWSTLSEQYSVSLNKEHKVKGEFPIQFVSCAGVRSEYFGAFSVYPPKKVKNEIIVKPWDNGRLSRTAAFSFGGRETFGNGNLNAKTYFVRIESLDTGEQKDFCICTEYTNLPTLEQYHSIESVIFSENIHEKSLAESHSTLQGGILASSGGDINPNDRLV